MNQHGEKRMNYELFKKQMTERVVDNLSKVFTDQIIILGKVEKGNIEIDTISVVPKQEENKQTILPVIIEEIYGKYLKLLECDDIISNEEAFQRSQNVLEYTLLCLSNISLEKFADLYNDKFILEDFYGK